MTDGLQPFVCGDAEKLSETLGSMLPQSKSDSDIRMLRGRIKLWLRETVMLMVDNPGSVRVTDGNTEANALQIRLDVHLEDVGKVIGKGGRNARALRTMLLAIGHTQRHYFTLDIVDLRKESPKFAALWKQRSAIRDPEVKIGSQEEHVDVFAGLRRSAGQ